MQRKTTFSILLNLYLIQISYGDVFTAQISMEKILHVEKALGNDIMSYIHKEETRLEKLRKIATEYTTHSTEKLRNPEDYLANALNAYLFIKKFTVGWNETEKLISETYTDEFLTIIDGKTSDLPTQEDLEGAALALLRLQDTYALPTEAVAKGNLYGVKQSPRLTAGDCWELGLVAYMRKDFYHAVLWLNQSLSVLDEEDTKTTSKARVLEYLSWAMYKQGNIEHAHNLSIQCLEINPNNELVRKNKDFWKKMVEDGEISDDKRQSRGIQNERNLDAYRKSEEFIHYEALCRGEDVAEYKMAHKLTCQYRRHHPIFYLTPLKEEMLYFEPRILAYHDIITDSEIACIKKLATPKLRRATVKGVAGGPQQKAFYRVGKSGWLADSENPLIRRVSTKIQHLSSLSLETAEMMQVHQKLYLNIILAKMLIP